MGRRRRRTAYPHRAPPHTAECPPDRAYSAHSSRSSRIGERNQRSQMHEQRDEIPVKRAVSLSRASPLPYRSTEHRRALPRYPHGDLESRREWRVRGCSCRPRRRRAEPRQICSAHCPSPCGRRSIRPPYSAQASVPTGACCDRDVPFPIPHIVSFTRKGTALHEGRQPRSI